LANTNDDGEHLGRLHLTEGLDHNQRQLGSMEELLLSVQTDVNNAEKKLFGKVFDLQSERNFLARHQQIVSENDELQDGMEGLNEKIATMSSELDKVQRRFLSVKHNHVDAEKHMNEQVAENDFTIDKLHQELQGSHLIHKDYDRLMDLKKALIKEGEEINAVAEAADKELRDAKSTLHEEESLIQPNLQKQLVGQHSYGVSCHVKVHNLDQQLRAVLAAKPLQNSAEEAAAEHAARSNEAKDQRLRIENQLLKQQMQHAEAALEGLKEEERAAQAKLAQLKQEIVTEKQAVLNAMSNLKEHMTTMQDAMQQNIDQRKTKEAALIIESDTLEELQQKMSVSGMDNLRSENAKLKAMLEGSQSKLQASQASEAEAKAFEQEKLAENAALQETAHLSLKKAEEAMGSAQKQVSNAAHESESTQAKAKAVMEQAEAAVAAKCKPEWDSRSSKAESKMSKCRVWQDDLAAANAEIETLKVALEAQGLHM
jgi:hypothetical protein